MSTVVVVPCYNEERRLDREAIRACLRNEPGLRLLFVNDGSRDGTLSVLEGLHAESPQRLLFLDLPANQGKAEAVRQGMLAAWDLQPKQVGFWDADLATPLGAIRQFRDVLERRRDIDMVIGTRIALAGRRISRRPLRAVIGRSFARVASGMLGLPLRDTQCGAKLFRATPQMRLLFSERFVARWIFDVELFARLLSIKGAAGALAAIYELPLDDWHDVPGSNLRGRDALKILGELAGIYARYCWGRWAAPAAETPPFAPGALPLRAPTFRASSPPAVSVPGSRYCET